MMADPRYWKATRRLTLGLLLVWCFMTFGLSWFSSALNDYELFGFPAGFYMSAQGTLLVYLGLIWYYNRRMRQIDREFGVAED
jgi:putative solute:sodium symporter small subunit